MEPLGLEVYKLRRFGVQTPGTQAVEKSEKVYAKWVHGPLEKLQINKTCFRTDHETA